jgi:hypothetical protein
VQNTFWQLSSGGAVISSGAIPVFSGQTQTTPLGASDILISGSSVYVPTCMAGVLVQIQ